MNRKQIKLDELARYSDWPGRIMSPEVLSVRHKTEQEVKREFENEKWARLLDFIQTEKDISLEKVEDKYHPLTKEIPGYDSGKFYLAPYGDFLSRQFKLYTEILAPYAKNASSLVELGAGYGSKIFHLSTKTEFTKLPLIAAEIYPNGREALRLLSDALDIPLRIGSCDFRNSVIDACLVPKGALIFTSLSAHYIPELPPSFIDLLIKLKPSTVVHFEPIYEHFSDNSLHDLMCRRYMEVNDYTRNLQTVIDDAVTKQKIRIILERRRTLGLNPFLPFSILVWQPLGAEH